MERGKSEAWVRGKQQLKHEGSFLQGGGAGAVFFSEPAVTQRGAEHRGHYPHKVASSAPTKALMKNRAGLSLTQELQLCQKSHG